MTAVAKLWKKPEMGLQLKRRSIFRIMNQRLPGSVSIE